MSYRINSHFYIPRTKKDLLGELLPTWQGRKTDLREMGIRTLQGILAKKKQENMIKVMKCQSG